MNRSRIAAPLDRIEGVCADKSNYIRAGYRKQGLTRTLLDAALALAKKRKARFVEACPIDSERKLVWGEGYVGLAPVFRAAGFAEVARRSPTRPLMRKVLRST